MERRRLELPLAFLLPFLVALCFAAKPVHQDDWAYLRAAAYLLEDPSTFLEQTTLYQGLPITVAQGVLHGPVWMWVLASCLSLGGAALAVAHGFSAACLGLLGLSSASLAGRLGAPRLSTALLVALSPLPLVLAGNLMTGLPMLALFAASLAAAARAYAAGSTRWLVLAGVLGAAAALTRYHGMAILPMLAVMPLLWPREWSGLVRAWLPFLVSFALVGGYLVLTSLLQGQADSGRASDALLAELDRIDHTACLLAAVAAMGGSLLGPALAGLTAPGRLAASLRRPGTWVIVALALGGAVAASVVAEDGSRVLPEGVNLWLQRLLFFLGSLGAFIAVGRVVAGGGDEASIEVSAEASTEERGALARLRATRGRELFLLLWLGGFLLAAWVTVPFGSTRYALPIVPALVLLFAASATRALGARVVHLAVLPMALVGLASAVTDYKAAGVYPEFAERLATERAEGAPRAQGDLWIWGELDFRWYLEEHPGLATANAAPRPGQPERVPGPPRVIGREARVTGTPAAGDHIVRSAICTSAPNGLSGIYQLPRDLWNRMENAGVDAFDDPWPLRIHNSHAAAGFYHADGGLLPFAFSTEPHDRIQLFRVAGVDPFLEAFPSAQVETTDAVSLPGGNVKVEQFLVYEGVDRIEQKPAVSIVFPGRVTWAGVSVPAGATRLEFLVAEHDRAAFAPGPGAILRVRLNGEVAWEATIDSRREEGHRKWLPAHVDLSAVAGGSVDVTIEAVEGPWPDKPADHSGPAPISVGFAELRIR